MRIFILFLLFLPLFLSAEPAKVVGVIPVKFNSKGMHAPVPYSQQLMGRGWTRVPTLNLPFTFAGGGQFNPRYQPTTVTKKSFARSLGYLAGRVANMTPATKALLIGYGAYEANCITQNYPSLCISDEFDPNQDLTGISDFKPAKIVADGYCAFAPPPLGGQSVSYGCSATISGAVSVAAPSFATALQSACMSVGTRTSCSVAVRSITGTSARYDLSYTYDCQQDMDPEMETCTTNNPDYRGQDFSVQAGQPRPVCPPDPITPDDEETPLYVNGPLKVNGQDRCFKNTTPQPITPEWIEEQLDENPEPAKNADIGLDDFVDWETGLPRPDVFEDPTLDPVSDAFADAAEAIANGTVQHSNPSAPGYVPADMMPNLLVQINNWHEGNTFTDVFSGKEVNPEAPPPEKQEIDWSKFPGITKAHYEASNNTWGQAATNSAPNIDSEIDKLTQEQDKLKDFINEPLPPMPFEINLIDLLNLPTSNGCKGFTVPAQINGQPKSITVNQHCPPYDAWGRPVVSWLLSIFTILVCFQIFRRTLEVTF